LFRPCLTSRHQRSRRPKRSAIALPDGKVTGRCALGDGPTATRHGAIPTPDASVVSDPPARDHGVRPVGAGYRVTGLDLGFRRAQRFGDIEASTRGASSAGRCSPAIVGGSGDPFRARAAAPPAPSAAPVRHTADAPAVARRPGEAALDLVGAEYCVTSCGLGVFVNCDTRSHVVSELVEEVGSCRRRS
jgi:hypothetical protein